MAELAHGRPQRPGRRHARRSSRTWRPGSPTSRARPSRPSPSPGRSRAASGHPEHAFDLPIELQVADRTISDAEARGAETPHRGPDPRAVVERRRGQDRRSSSAPSTSTTGCGRFGFGEPDRRPVPGRGAGHRADPPSTQFSGSTMGNLPIGQGLSVTPMQMAAAYSAIADGGDPAPAAAGPRPRAASAVAGAAGPAGDQRPDRRRAAPDARGRAGPGRHRLRGQRARLHARRQDRNRAGRPSNGGYSDTQFVASFVGFAPAQDPRLLVAVVVDQPAGRQLLRRHGRGARRSARSRSSRSPTSRSRRTSSGGASARRLLESPRWSSASCSPAPTSPRSPGTRTTEISGLAYDSRRVEPGDLFFCVRGQRADGHDFAAAAVEARRRGAGGRAPPRAARDPG